MLASFRDQSLGADKVGNKAPSYYIVSDRTSDIIQGLPLVSLVELATTKSCEWQGLDIG